MKCRCAIAAYWPTVITQSSGIILLCPSCPSMIKSPISKKYIYIYTYWMIPSKPALLFWREAPAILTSLPNDPFDSIFPSNHHTKRLDNGETLTSIPSRPRHLIPAHHNRTLPYHIEKVSSRKSRIKILFGMHLSLIFVENFVECLAHSTRWCGYLCVLVFSHWHTDIGLSPII
jgi:hypothetical protein